MKGTLFQMNDHVFEKTKLTTLLGSYLIYSLRKESIGLAVATLIDW